jgi:hypothetical protein
MIGKSSFDGVPLAEFYAAGDGDLMIRAFDAIKGEEICFLPREHAEKVFNYIYSNRRPSKESLIVLAIGL